MVGRARDPRILKQLANSNFILSPQDMNLPFERSLVDFGHFQIRLTAGNMLQIFQQHQHSIDSILRPTKRSLHKMIADLLTQPGAIAHKTEDLCSHCLFIDLPCIADSAQCIGITLYSL